MGKQFWNLFIFTLGFVFVILISENATGQITNRPRKEPIRDYPQKRNPFPVKPFSDPIPIDSSVIIGHLENGLTYYLKKNLEPRNRAELRLVVNVGSVLENDQQLGLAHFTEHMAFNGTKHFQKNDLVGFLEKSGVKFGADLNAHTSFDETVYQLSLPTDATSLPGDSMTLFDKGFTILEDWAHSLSFNDAEIDKERGVVIEEWRLGRGANARLRDQYFPIVFKNSRYATRLPIGNKENLKSFSHTALKQFYQDWYRPDLEAIIVVGDIDLKKTEALIRLNFSKLKNPLNEKVRVLYNIPYSSETRIASLTDPEQPYTTAQWVNKLPKAPDKTLQDLESSISRDLFNNMMKARLAEIIHQPSAPFLFANSSYNPYLSNLDAYQNFVLVSGGGKVTSAIKALLKETERVKQFGFTEKEFERAKKEILGKEEKIYREKDKTNSKVFVNLYIDHFLHQSSIPSIEFEYSYLVSHINSISLSAVNALANDWLKEENRYLIVTAPEKEKANLPSVEMLKESLHPIFSTPLTPYQDQKILGPLFETTLHETKLDSIKSYKNVGVEEFKLTNGMRILLKPTVFKNNQILLGGFRKGGTSNFSDSQYLNAVYASPVVEEGGLANFDNIMLEKLLAGKELRVSPFIDQYQQGFTGNSTINDLETALQLLYLYFTKPRKDAKAFQALIEKETGILLNRSSDPATVFADSVSAIMSQNNIRNKSVTSADLKHIQLDSAFTYYKQAFSNPAEFTFVFVGNFETSKIKSLISKYLGTIASSKSLSQIKDDLHDYPTGFIKKVINKGQEPKSQVRLFFTGNLKYTPELQGKLTVLLNGLDIKLREALREDKGGTYGVGVYGGIDRAPKERFHIMISFGCAPENSDTLINLVMKEIQKIQNKGIEKVDLEKVKSQNSRQTELAIVKNEFWLRKLMERSFWNDSFEDILKEPSLISQVTAEQTKDLALQVFGPNKVEIILMPNKK